MSLLYFTAVYGVFNEKPVKPVKHNTIGKTMSACIKVPGCRQVGAQLLKLEREKHKSMSANS